MYTQWQPTGYMFACPALQYLQHNLFAVKPPEAEEVWTSLRISIDLVNVSLELLPIQLFEHPEGNPEHSHLPSLARIDFIKSKFEFESFSDWSKTIDLVSEEVIFEDTRQKGIFGLSVWLKWNVFNWRLLRFFPTFSSLKKLLFEFCFFCFLRNDLYFSSNSVMSSILISYM